MKFGLYSSIANPPRGEDLPRCVDEVIKEAQLAEQAGFDSCFFGEHHQDKDGFLPSPLIVCAAVSASTNPEFRLFTGASPIVESIMFTASSSVVGVVMFTSMKK